MCADGGVEQRADLVQVLRRCADGPEPPRLERLVQKEHGPCADSPAGPVAVGAQQGSFRVSNPRCRSGGNVRAAYGAVIDGRPVPQDIQQVDLIEALSEDSDGAESCRSR